jgi:DNA gyrase inhibitor GyrI
MTRIVALCALAALALGCGSAGGGTATGLKGYVKRGPTMPVCRVGVPCDAPAKGVKLRFSRAGKVAATATTNNRGWYRVVLRAGRYAVGMNAKGDAFGPRSATVQSGRMTRRDFLIDTGIR